MSVALPTDARAGLYGKLPARGDFVRENLPRDFTDAWDEWFQRGIAASRERFAESWVEAWLEAPVWRFLLPPGLCGRAGVLGVWMPSVDKAGRYFPLTLAATASEDWAPHLAVMAPFLDAAEQAGRDALEFDLSPADLACRLRDALVPADTGMALPAIPEGEAGWWTEGGPRVAPFLGHGPTLPEGADFAALIDDGWVVSRAGDA